MIRLQIQTFLRFRFAAIRRMAAAAIANVATANAQAQNDTNEFNYEEQKGTIANGNDKEYTKANVFEFPHSVAKQAIYSRIDKKYWSKNGYARVSFKPSPGGIMYVKRTLKTAPHGRAAGSFSGYERNSGQYETLPPQKGGKHRHTKRRHHKKRQTKRRH